MRKLFISIVLFFQLGVVGATEWSYGKILKLRYQSNAILITQELAQNKLGCANFNYIYFPLNETVFSKNASAALLAAYTTQTPVSIGMISCNPYPVVGELWVNP
ncbi:MAG: hypothetical protein OEX19_05900 [Gammaproteobacteria bacterium]|nr:hypothetical protein [Gammaproteobacteria bacterium]